MEIMNEYIVAVVFAICLGAGYLIKNSLTFIQNKYIPLIVGILGIIINIWANTGAFTPEILLGGLSSGLAATGGYELLKNIKKD